MIDAIDEDSDQDLGEGHVQDGKGGAGKANGTRTDGFSGDEQHGTCYMHSTYT